MRGTTNYGRCAWVKQIPITVLPATSNLSLNSPLGQLWWGQLLLDHWLIECIVSYSSVRPLVFPQQAWVFRCFNSAVLTNHAPVIQSLSTSKLSERKAPLHTSMVKSTNNDVVIGRSLTVTHQ